LVIDGRNGIGNGMVFPAGPLRAPLDAQLAHANALLVIGHGSGADAVPKARAAAARVPWQPRT
jgi:tetraacyldisaccharide 4'-kinase